MKGFTLLSAVALTTVLSSVATAQKSVPSAGLNAEEARTVVLNQLPEIRHIDLSGDFQPASGANPYIYLQTMVARWSDAGTYAFSYAPFTNARTVGDDVVLMSSTPDPGAGYSTTTPVACLSGFTFAIAAVNPLPDPSSQGTLRLNIAFYPWNGLFGTAAAAPAIATESVDITFAPNTTTAVILVTLSAQNIQLPKAFWIAFEPDQINSNNVNLANIGPVISNSTPGSVSLLPGRGYFRSATPPTAFTTVTGGSVFTTIPQGSLYLALRGTHNFVGTIDMSALSSRAQPQDPLLFEFDTGTDAEKALRRNLVDVEVVNDSGTPFISRFSTYIDEKGQFTLPVSNAIASITIRRWDNGLAVTFNRPADGWSTDVCNPTTATAQMTFGDVNGDGIIDDADLLTVLFGFGNIE